MLQAQFRPRLPSRNNHILLTAARHLPHLPKSTDHISNPIWPHWQ